MLLPQIHHRALAVSQRCAAGFSLLELSLSLALGLVVLMLAVTAVITAQRQWHQQQRGWQALLSLQFIANYLTQDLQQAYPQACPSTPLAPDFMPSVVSLPIARDHQLNYVRCEDGHLVRVRVWLQRGTIYRKVNADKAMQLLTGVAQFDVNVVSIAVHHALVQMQLALQAGETWPIDVSVRGT